MPQLSLFASGSATAPMVGSSAHLGAVPPPLGTYAIDEGKKRKRWPTNQLEANRFWRHVDARLQARNDAKSPRVLKDCQECRLKIRKRPENLLSFSIKNISGLQPILHKYVSKELIYFSVILNYQLKVMEGSPGEVKKEKNNTFPNKVYLFDCDSFLSSFPFK